MMQRYNNFPRLPNFGAANPKKTSPRFMFQAFHLHFHFPTRLTHSLNSPPDQEGPGVVCARPLVACHRRDARTAANTSVNKIHHTLYHPQLPFSSTFHAPLLWAKETPTFLAINPDFPALKLPVSFRLHLRVFCGFRFVNNFHSIAYFCYMLHVTSCFS